MHFEKHLFHNAALRILVLCLFLLTANNNLLGEEKNLSILKTRAETSNYEETTRYDEVMSFLNIVTATSERMHLTSFGYTTEGRKLPLVIYGDVANAGAEAVLQSGKTRIFVQANIHAGEVCGKEAMLILLRALANGEHAAWSENLVLLFAPIYNADGNERISLYNRRRQHGPIAGMGQRANAQGYDLNRDHIKLDSPEARSLIRLMNDYDPHVLLDIHTTNGTRHAYHLTYSPALNPNTHQPMDSFVRKDWLPTVTKAVNDKYNWRFYYYGNLPWPGMKVERGWYTFDHRPRFNNNYIGLRNRFAFLGEAYSYATFEERILAARYFVEEILNFAHENADTIREMTATADNADIIGTQGALRAKLASSKEKVEILFGEVSEEKNPYTGRTILRRKDVSRPEQMYEYGTFEPTETEIVPEKYFIPDTLVKVVDILETQGIKFNILEKEQTVQVERFRIDSTIVAKREFQKHKPRTVFGHYEKVGVQLPAGALIVPMDQPLARLAFYLLEPRSDDGLVNWNFLDEDLEDAQYYPIFRKLRSR